MLIKYIGGEAEHHRIPAYYGAISLRGFARIFVMTGHYVATGKIRRRYPYDDTFEIYYRAQQEGSLEQLIEIVTNSEIVKSAVGNAIGNALTPTITNTTKLLKKYSELVIKKASGLNIEDDEFLPELDTFAPNETDALVESLQPAIKDAHIPITLGINKIALVENGHKLLTLDQDSHDYVNSSILDERESVSLGRTAALNVNSKTGRIFLFEYGRNLSFAIDRHASQKTLGIISNSLNRYAHEREASILLRYQKVSAADQRLKKIIILDAEYPSE